MYNRAEIFFGELLLRGDPLVDPKLHYPIRNTGLSPRIYCLFSKATLVMV